MNRTTILILVCVAFAPLIAWLVYTAFKPAEPPPATTEVPLITNDELQGDEDVTGDVSAATGMGIEAYVRDNISALSPEPAVLGGTFFVTDIETTQNAGTVSYEDGHNAYTADFTYEIDANEKITITSFVVRPTPVPR